MIRSIYQKIIVILGVKLAIYPTKTSKINNKSKKFKTGITLSCVFSVLFVLLAFNFFQILTKIFVGTFGLLIYPVCLFFVVLGILLMLNKNIKTSKPIIVFSILWLTIFMLILQLATSKNIGIGFGGYISQMYKGDITAGGVIFGTLLYPIYYLSYDVASYIILLVALVIFTSLLIDKIYIELKNKKTLETTKVDTITQEQSEELSEDNEDEVEQKVTYKPDTDEDIFISDEEENEQKNEAKSILGLVKDSSNNKTLAHDDDLDYTKELEKQFTVEEATSKTDDKKPNIYVHEDEFENVQPTFESIEKPTQPIVDKDEERKKAALDYLNISKGKFETKNTKTGFDNVTNKTSKSTEVETLNIEKQTDENRDRLSNISNRLNQLSSQNKQNNPDEKPTQMDIYDEDFTKADFIKNKDSFANKNNNFNRAINNLPKMAEQVYSGEVKENLVDSTGFRPVQVSMEAPAKANLPQHKLYKKPPTYVKPPIDLLKQYSTNIESDSDYINQKGQLIVETLKAFKIDTKIINAIKGPTFTRYELQMAPGISVNSVNTKINDLSMALESQCRVQVPIPGKNAFGIEVPNKKRMTVGLREILESQNFQNSKSPLTFALGKDISATCKVACIDKLVHTLVAGSTNSGKSVCLNTMLVSLLYKASPEDVKLILVDPKTVEFSMFNNLPHMLIPNTITDCEKAVSALNWLVEEMERRYKRLGQLGVKKISEYNETPEVISGSVPKMYYIVMVFDEVGDFMAVAKKEIEEKIMRLAAKSRACGIHLVLATQRPTVDVITGTIKTNLPSRIAFAVNSYQDSKTILESSGAEYLLGMGDMLFVPQGSNDMDRIQGCFIDNNELKQVIKFIKENNESVYDETIEDQMFNKHDGFDSSNGVEDAFDPLLKDCLKYFIRAKKASASSLQAYFGIGYPKANKIVLQMEKAGFVSPGDSNGRRQLYITQQEFEERFGENLDE